MTSVPHLFTRESIKTPESETTIICNEAGMPMENIFFTRSRSVVKSHLRILKIGFFLAMYRYPHMPARMFAVMEPQAAPVSPNAGKGPGPAMSSGTRLMFSSVARKRILSGVFESPRPLSVPFIQLKKKPGRNPMKVMPRKADAMGRMAGGALTSPSSTSRRKMPATVSARHMMSMTENEFESTFPSNTMSFLPYAWAIRMFAAMERPIRNEGKRKRIGIAAEMAATASWPSSRPTQIMLMILYAERKKLPAIRGIEKVMTWRRMLPLVKSRTESSKDDRNTIHYIKEDFQWCISEIVFTEKRNIYSLSRRGYRRGETGTMGKKSRKNVFTPEQLLSSLMDNIPDHIYFKDAQSRFIRTNRAQARFLGLAKPEDAIGKTDHDFFAHADEALADEQNILRSGKPLVGKIERVRYGKGPIVSVSTTKAPITDSTGKAIGIVGITRDINDRMLEEERLKSAQEELENTVRTIDMELNIARNIQESMLPERLDQIDEVKVAALYIPCSTIGGDLYDVIQIDEDRIALLILDVMGHGIPAALIAAMAKVSFTKHIARGLKPRTVLREVNDELIAHLKNERFLTVFLGIVDKARKEFVFARASHPPALLLRKRRRTVVRLSGKGIFIGFAPRYKYEEERVPLESGDIILLYTDGLVECRNKGGVFYGLKRLERLLLKHRDAPVDELVKRIREAHVEFMGDVPPSDDIAVLIATLE